MTTATLAGPRRVVDNGERRRMDDEYLTRREAETLIDAGRERNEAAKEAHDAVHESQLTALQTAMAVQERDRIAHNIAHEREHELHAEKHNAERQAVGVAMEAVARERTIHAEAHEREHISHRNEHGLNNLALDKAERANDIRFTGVNEFREQLRDQAALLASAERVETLAKDTDRRFTEMLAVISDRFTAAEKLTQDRYDANRASIIAIEKADVKGEGRTIGQGVVLAAIIGIVSFVGTVLGIVIIVANFVSAS